MDLEVDVVHGDDLLGALAERARHAAQLVEGAWIGVTVMFVSPLSSVSDYSMLRSASAGRSRAARMPPTAPAIRPAEHGEADRDQEQLQVDRARRARCRSSRR